MGDLTPGVSSHAPGVATFFGNYSSNLNLTAEPANQGLHDYLKLSNR